MYELVVVAAIILIVLIVGRAENFYSSGSNMRKMVDIDSSTMQGQDVGDFHNTELRYYLGHTP